MRALESLQGMRIAGASHVMGKFQGPHSRIVVALRRFLVGRDLVLAHRTTDVASTRSPAQPHLPDGPAHQLDKNYYYSRDLRRSVFSPSIVASNLNQLASHEDSSFRK